MCSAESFIALCFMCLDLWSLLSWLLYMVQDTDHSLYFWIWIFTCPSTLLGDYPFSIDFPLHLCQKSVTHTCVNLSLDSLFCSFNLLCNLDVTTTTFITVGWSGVLKLGIVCPLTSFYFKSSFHHLNVLQFHMNFRIMCPSRCSA